MLYPDFCNAWFPTGCLGRGLLLQHSRAPTLFLCDSISASLDQVSERNCGKLIGIFHSPFLKAKPLLCRQKDLPMGKTGQSTFASKRAATGGNLSSLLQHTAGIILNKWFQNLSRSASEIDGGRRPFVFFFFVLVFFESLMLPSKFFKWFGLPYFFQREDGCT